MANHAKVLSVSEADAGVLRQRVRSRSAPARVVERARIVLLAGEGLAAQEIAERVGCSRPKVKWRSSYAQGGLAALEDAPRSGAPRRMPGAQADILFATLDGPPAELGVTHWSCGCWPPIWASATCGWRGCGRSTGCSPGGRAR